MAENEKSPLQRLKERRRSVLGKKEMNKLMTVMVPPADLTNAIVKGGRNVTVPSRMTEEKRAQGYILSSEIHDDYWKWCHDQQNERREIFLRWMGAISADAEPLRLGRYRNGVFIGKVLKRDPRFGLAEHFGSHKWPDLVWQLAEAIFPGLRLPEEPRKQGAEPMRPEAILDAVAHQHRADPNISREEAIARAKYASGPRSIGRDSFYKALKALKPPGGKSWWKLWPEN
jgi:hypothetical protein